jgi:hypothetical protein
MTENEATWTWRETKIIENGATAAWREREMKMASSQQ